MNKEDKNKNLKKLFSEFGWISTDLNKFIEKADKKTVIENSE